MQPYKLIAFDMDGTLICESNRIPAPNLEWIHRAHAAGLKTTLATGRHRKASMDHFASEMGIDVPVVTLNGGEVWVPDGTLLSQNPLPVEDMVFLCDCARRYKLNYVGFSTDGLIREAHFPAELSDTLWLKFVFRANDTTAMSSLLKELHDCNRFTVSSSHSLNIEVNPHGISKAYGLQVVCDYLNIAKHEVVTMGDGENDIEMLRWAGLGIAMANASKEVKDAADYVTDTCDANGAANAIEKILQGKL